MCVAQSGAVAAARHGCRGAKEEQENMADKPLPTEQAKPAAARPAGKTPKAVAAAQAQTTVSAETFQEQDAFGVWLRAALRQTPSWLVSTVVHMIVLLALALLTLPDGIADDLRQLVVSPGEEEEFDELEDLEDDEPLEDLNLEVTALQTEVVQEEMEVSPADDMEAAPVHVELSPIGLEHAPRNDLLAAVGAYTGTGLSGRGQGKGQLVRKYGGSAGSENAVAMALKWLAEHQMPDGGWSFDHRLAPRCQGQCRNPGGDAKARIAATAMAVLPFLGAGQTHQTGKYKATVNRGLYFLSGHMKVSAKGGDLTGSGRMYSHGLASITLCEAYAMTHDKNLHAPAQAAINFIVYAQDPVGGGWRYTPRQKGDTSVVGWQIMALKSGHMAYLRVPPLTVQMASRYLDAVQANSGANYGYTGPGSGPATTAIGLLCRMYLGWKKDNPALQRGVKWISDKGPVNGNMYYNYYATQVMRHWEGKLWKKWNAVMRDQLVNAQSKNGHETGSWHFAQGDHGGTRGGRLYTTSMATMILEVYYRHLPIFRKQSTEEDFPE